MNAIIVVVGLLFCCLMLFVHVALTDKYRSDMESVDKQLNSIQWPIGRKE